MTDSEIVKALECCKKKGSNSCKECPLYFLHSPECINILSKYALDLINRLQAENERLKNAYKQCAFERDAYIEIENTAIAEAKAEAYQEFAERLKAKAKPHYFDNCNFAVPIEDIDNLSKELVGEDDASLNNKN